LPQLLLRSTAFLNSLFVFVFALFMIDVMTAQLQYLHLVWLALIVAFPVKIYCASGIYGYLIEIASGQELTLDARRFTANANRYWWMYLAVLGVLHALHLSIHALIPSSRMIPFSLFYPFFGILAAAVFAGWIIADKYIKPWGLGYRKIPAGPGIFAIVLAVYLLEIGLSWLPAVLPVGDFDWPRLAAFALKYLHLLEMLFFAFVILDAYPEIGRKFEGPKEVFLINPISGGVLDGVAFMFVRGYPPVFVVLKALTPKDYKFREFNRLIWRERYYKSNKLVAITCYTPNCAEAYKIAKEFKRRGSKVVMGGPHVTYLPEEALAFCDSVVIGEAEGVWKEVIKDYENGTLKPKYMGAAIEDYHQEVHRELLQSPPHIIKEFLETTRGCKYRCHFCTIPSLSGGRTRKKPVGEIVELIAKIKHRYPAVTFIDNNIYSDPGYAKELFTALKPLKIKWRTQCTIDIAKNEETLRLAKDSGCDGFLFGYEIFGGSLEKQQGGKFAMAQKYIEYTNIIKKAGIKIKAHFIFGFDSDNFSNLGRLWQFCFNIMPLWTIVSVLTPLPGSRVYYDMLTENRITNLNWRNYAMHNLVIRHPRMDQEIVSKVFPFIRTFFLLTTSSGGLVLSAIVAWALLTHHTGTLLDQLF
jgi:radical SAM superfamily enzyme YgiQ (UPF0313 family)